MRIIKQFKENSTPGDIFKRMQKGDVVNINNVLYIKGEWNILISEFGTTWDMLTLAKLCVMSEIRCLAHREIGDDIISTMLVAEGGIYERM